MAFLDEDYEKYYGRLQPARGCNTYENSRDNNEDSESTYKYSKTLENSEFYHKEEAKISESDFRKVRPFDDPEEPDRFKGRKVFLSKNNYSIRGARGNHNKRGRGVNSLRGRGFSWKFNFQSRNYPENSRYKYSSTDTTKCDPPPNNDSIHKTSTSYETNLKRSPPKCSQKNSPGSKYQRSPDNAFYRSDGQKRKRHHTSLDAYSYKSENVHSNSGSKFRVSDSYRSRSRSWSSLYSESSSRKRYRSGSRRRRSRDGSRKRAHRSRSTSTSHSRSSSRNGRWRTYDRKRGGYRSKSPSRRHSHSPPRNRFRGRSYDRYNRSKTRSRSRSPAKCSNSNYKEQNSSNRSLSRRRSRSQSWSSDSSKSSNFSRSSSSSRSRSHSPNNSRVREEGRYKRSSNDYRSPKRNLRYKPYSHQKDFRRRSRSRDYRSQSRSRSHSPARDRNDDYRSYRRSRSQSWSSTDARSPSRKKCRSRSSQRNSRDRSKSRGYQSLSSISLHSRSSCSSRSRSRSRRNSRNRESRSSSRPSQSPSRNGVHRSHSNESRSSSVCRSKRQSRSHSLARLRREPFKRQTLGSRSSSGSSLTSLSVYDLQRSDSESSLSSITSTRSRSSSRGRSSSAERSERKTPVHIETESSPSATDTSKHTTFRSGKFQGRKRTKNEDFVRRQYERFEKEREEKMLANVDDLLERLVGDVAEHSHAELVNEPVTAKETSDTSKPLVSESTVVETEYRTVQIKPKPPEELGHTHQKCSALENSNHCTPNLHENLKIFLHSSQERNVVCMKDHGEMEGPSSARKRKSLSQFYLEQMLECGINLKKSKEEWTLTSDMQTIDFDGVHEKTTSKDDFNQLDKIALIRDSSLNVAQSQGNEEKVTPNIQDHKSAPKEKAAANVDCHHDISQSESNQKRITPNIQRHESASEVIQVQESLTQKEFSSEIATQNMLNQDSAPQIMKTPKSVNQHMLSQDSAPQIMKTPENVNENMLSQDSALQIMKTPENVNQNMPSQDSAPQIMKTPENVNQNMLSQDSALQIMKTPENVNQNMPSQDSAPQIMKTPENVNQNMPSQDSAPQIMKTPENVNQNMPSQDSALQIMKTPENVNQNMPSQDSALQIMKTPENVNQNMPSQDSALQIMKTPENVNQNMPSQDSAPQIMKTPENVNQNMPSQVSALQIMKTPENVNQNMPSQDSAPQIMKTPENVNQNMLSQDSAPQIMKTPESVNQNMPSQDSAPQIMKTPENVNENMLNQDSAPQIMKTPENVNQNMPSQDSLAKNLESNQNTIQDAESQESTSQNTLKEVNSTQRKVKQSVELSINISRQQLPPALLKNIKLFKPLETSGETDTTAKDLTPPLERKIRSKLIEGKCENTVDIPMEINDKTLDSGSSDLGLLSFDDFTDSDQEFSQKTSGAEENVRDHTETNLEKMPPKSSEAMNVETTTQLNMERSSENALNSLASFYAELSDEALNKESTGDGIMVKTSTPVRNTSVSRTSTPVRNTGVSRTSTPVRNPSVSRTSTPVRDTGDSRTSTPVRNTGVSRTSTPVRNTGVSRTSTPVRNTGDSRTSTPVRNTGVSRTSTPVRDTGDSRTSTPVRNTSVSRTSTPVRDTGDSRTSTPVRNTGVSRTSTPVRNTGDSRTSTPVRNTGVSRTSTPVRNMSVSREEGLEKHNGEEYVKISLFTANSSVIDQTESLHSESQKSEVVSVGEAQMANNAEESAHLKLNAKSTEKQLQSSKDKGWKCAGKNSVNDVSNVKSSSYDKERKIESKSKGDEITTKKHVNTKAKTSSSVPLVKNPVIRNKNDERSVVKDIKSSHKKTSEERLKTNKIPTKCFTPAKKTDFDKEKSASENNSTDSIYDETLPMLKLRKDKQDASTTSIDSSDSETSKPKLSKQGSETQGKLKEMEQLLSKGPNKNSLSVSSKEKEKLLSKKSAKDSDNVSDKKTCKAMNIMSRKPSLKSPRIKLIDQDDLFLLDTLYKRSRVGSSKTKDTKSKACKALTDTKDHKTVCARKKSTGTPHMLARKPLQNTVSVPACKPAEVQSTSEESGKVSKKACTAMRSSEVSNGMRASEISSVTTGMRTSEISPENIRMDTPMKCVPNNRDTEGNDKENGGKIPEASKISALGAKRQSRELSTEQMKVLQRNKEVRERTCQELKQGKQGGRKMSKSGKIQKMKHIVHVEKIQAKTVKKHVSKSKKDKDEKMRRVLCNLSTQRITNKSSETAEGKKSLTECEQTVKTDTIAKNILQTVPGRIEIFDSEFNRITYSSTERAEDSAKKTNPEIDKVPDGSLNFQEYTSVLEDEDEDTDDEKLQIDLDSVSPEKKNSPTNSKRDKQAEIQVGGEVNATIISDPENNTVQNSEDKEPSTSESTMEATKVMTEKREEGNILSSEPDNFLNIDLFSPANPSATISEDIDYNDIRIMYYNYGVPQSPYVAEEDIAQTPGKTQNQREATPSTGPETDQTAKNILPEEVPPKSQVAVVKPRGRPETPNKDISSETDQTAKKILSEKNLSVSPAKSHVAVIKPRGRPETPSKDISSGTDQTAREILPEDLLKSSVTDTNTLQLQQSTSKTPNVSSSQDTEVSSDYGTDSNRGTPYSDISESCDEPEKNKTRGVPNQETKLWPLLGNLGVNAYEHIQHPAFVHQVYCFISGLRKKSLENCKPIGFTHYKSFKNMQLTNSNLGLTVGFLEPKKFRDLKLRCIRCNLCGKYFDPCKFLVHYDGTGVELDEKKCLSAEPQPAVGNMETHVKNMWECMVTLKNLLVGIRLKKLSLDLEKSTERRNSDVIPRSQPVTSVLENNQSVSKKPKIDERERHCTAVEKPATSENVSNSTTEKGSAQNRYVHRHHAIPTDLTMTRPVNRPAQLTKRTETSMDCEGQSQRNVTLASPRNGGQSDSLGVKNVDFVSRQTAAPQAENVAGCANNCGGANIPVVPSNAHALFAMSHPACNFQQIWNIMPPPPPSQMASNSMVANSTSSNIQNRKEYLEYSNIFNVMAPGVLNTRSGKDKNLHQRYQQQHDAHQQQHITQKHQQQHNTQEHQQQNDAQQHNVQQQQNNAQGYQQQHIAQKHQQQDVAQGHQQQHIAQKHQQQDVAQGHQQQHIAQKHQQQDVAQGHQQQHNAQRHQQQYDAQRYRPPNLNNQTSMTTPLYQNQHIEMLSSRLQDTLKHMNRAGYQSRQKRIQSLHPQIGASLRDQNNLRPSQQHVNMAPIPTQAVTSRLTPSVMPPPCFPGKPSNRYSTMSDHVQQMPTVHGQHLTVQQNISQQMPTVHGQHLTVQQNISQAMAAHPVQSSVMQNQPVINNPLQSSTISRTHQNMSGDLVSSFMVSRAHQNSLPMSHLSHQNTLPISHLSHPNSLPTSHLSHQNTLPMSHLSHQNTLPTSHLSHQNMGLNHVSSQSNVNGLMNQSQNSQNLSSDKSSQISRSVTNDSSTPGSSGQPKMVSPVKDVQSFLQIASEMVSRFNPSSASSSSVDIPHPSLSNQNQIKESCFPNQRSHETEVPVINAASSGKPQGNSSNGESTSLDLLDAAKQLAKRISGPEDAQQKLVNSLVNMMAFTTWMNEQFQLKIAEVASAQQELQNCKEDVKKSMEEYQTTESLMTQKINEVLSKLSK